jgi:hypothetical protein
MRLVACSVVRRIEIPSLARYLTGNFRSKPCQPKTKDLKIPLLTGVQIFVPKMKATSLLAAELICNVGFNPVESGPVRALDAPVTDTDTSRYTASRDLAACACLNWP